MAKSALIINYLVNGPNKEATIPIMHIINPTNVDTLIHHKSIFGYFWKYLFDNAIGATLRYLPIFFRVLLTEVRYFLGLIQGVYPIYARNISMTMDAKKRVGLLILSS